MGEVKGQRYYVSLVVSQQANASFPAVVVLDVNEVEALNEDRITINMEALRDDIAQRGKVVLDGVYFDFDKATLTSESKEAITVIANYLKANGEQQFYVVGHTDGKGDLAYNRNLSKARAEAVIQALVETHAIARSRLLPVGVGPVSPVTSNTTDGGRELNRRVELVLQD